MISPAILDRVTARLRTVPLSISSTRRSGENGLRNADEVAKVVMKECEFAELRECVRLLLLSSEGQCAHDPEVLVARQNMARTLLAKLDGKP